MLETRSAQPQTAPNIRSRIIELFVNGERYEVAVKPRNSLVEVLREKIGLTGAKHGCEQGACGVCTVLLDDKPVLGCLTLAVECDGKRVRTVEGLAQGDRLSPIQQAFLDQGAVQCGYCTAGMLMSATALLERNPKPSLAEIKKALEGNICRCTGYNAIVAAVQQASGQGVEPVMR
ncbi:MAG: (2Fe-2S)-binding protein [Xanthobacteraceae bacterium]